MRKGEGWLLVTRRDVSVARAGVGARFYIQAPFVGAATCRWIWNESRTPASATHLLPTPNAMGTLPSFSITFRPFCWQTFLYIFIINFFFYLWEATHTHTTFLMLLECHVWPFFFFIFSHNLWSHLITDYRREERKIGEWRGDIGAIW
jgi:hypothetical protein